MHADNMWFQERHRTGSISFLSLQLHKSQAFLWMFEVAQLVKQVSAFTESKRLLPSKRLPTTGLCSEPHESIVHPHIRVLSFFLSFF